MTGKAALFHLDIVVDVGTLRVHVFSECLGVNACWILVFLLPLECFVSLPTLLCRVETVERLSRTEISCDRLCVSQNVTVQQCVRLPKLFVSTSCFIITRQPTSSKAQRKRSRCSHFAFEEMSPHRTQCLLAGNLCISDQQPHQIDAFTARQCAEGTPSSLRSRIHKQV